MPESKIFERCDHFIDRLKMLKVKIFFSFDQINPDLSKFPSQDIISTAQECSIYESIELGGIDADEFQSILQKVIGDFKSAYSVFRGKIYIDSFLNKKIQYKRFIG